MSAIRPIIRAQSAQSAPIIRTQSATPTETTAFMSAPEVYPQEAVLPSTTPSRPPPAYFPEIVNTPPRVSLNHATSPEGPRPSSPMKSPEKKQVYPNIQ